MPIERDSAERLASAETAFTMVFVRWVLSEANALLSQHDCEIVQYANALTAEQHKWIQDLRQLVTTDTGLREDAFLKRGIVLMHEKNLMPEGITLPDYVARSTQHPAPGVCGRHLTLPAHIECAHRIIEVYEPKLYETMYLIATKWEAAIERHLALRAPVTLVRCHIA